MQGFNLTVGGGMGRTHRNNDTFPRIADPFCYVDKDDIFHAVRVWVWMWVWVGVVGRCGCMCAHVARL